MTAFVAKWNSREVTTYLRRDAPRAVEQATVRGLNKGVRQVRTASQRAVRDRRGSLQIRRDIAPNYWITTATRARKTASVHVRGRAIPLKSYGARVVGKRGRGGGTRSGPGAHPVSVEVTRGQRKVVLGAFIGPGDHVFRRVGGSRLPIKKLHGPSLPATFETAAVQAAMTTKAGEIPRIIESQLRFELARASRRSRRSF